MTGRFVMVAVGVVWVHVHRHVLHPGDVVQEGVMHSIGDPVGAAYVEARITD